MKIEHNIKKKLSKVFKHKFSTFKITKSGRNNLIYKIKSQKRNYILKIFLKKNNNDVLSRELFFLQYCAKLNISIVPKVIIFGNNFILLSELKGTKPVRFTNDGFYQAIKFIFDININRNQIDKYKFNAIENAIDKNNLIKFTEKKFLKVYNLIKKSKNKELIILINQIKNLWKVEKKKLLSIKNFKFTKIISPSDFGIHNVFKFKKKYFFHDFEYSGIDSLEKLVCDFVLNPNSNLNLKEAKKVVIKFDNYFNLKSQLYNNVLIVSNTILIRWSLILLNSLFGDKKKQRIGAGSPEKLKIQIKKSKRILKKII